MASKKAIHKNLTGLKDYFSKYPAFTYNKNAAATSEFSRMCREFRWKKGEPQQKEAYQVFRDALTKQFNSNFGTDVNSLKAWQNLCRELKVNPTPSTVKGCREAVTTTHANLVDLVQGKAVTFPTVFELSNYTRKEGKIFPREDIHAGDLLKYLLRHIENPSLDANRATKRRGQKRRGRS